MTARNGREVARRTFLLGTAALAGTSLLGCGSTQPVVPAPRGARATASGTLGRRKLGSLEVSSLGLGCQNVSRTYQSTVPSRPDMIKLIRAAHDRGVTFFDSAEAYGPHEAERILGEGIAPIRDHVVITSKFGWNIDLDTGERRPGLNSRPDHVKLAVDGMLKRLRTDRIDLLYQHRVDPDVPIEDVAGAVKDLVAAGKVLHWGLCEMGPSTLRRAHAEQRLTAVQNEYSLLWRGPEKWLLAACEELGIGLVPWSPLGMAFLTGGIQADTRFVEGDFRKRVPRFAPENLPHNMALVRLVQQWAQRKKRDASADRSRVANGAAPVDCAHSRNDADAALGRKPRRGDGRAHVVGARRAEHGGLGDPGAGRASPGRGARALGVGSARPTVRATRTRPRPSRRVRAAKARDPGARHHAETPSRR